MNHDLERRIRATEAKAVAARDLESLAALLRTLDAPVEFFRRDYAGEISDRLMTPQGFDDLESILYKLRVKCGSLSAELASEYEAEWAALRIECDGDVDARTLADMPDRPKLMAAE